MAAAASGRAGRELVDVENVEGPYLMYMLYNCIYLPICMSICVYTFDALFPRSCVSCLDAESSLSAHASHFQIHSL